MHRICPIKTHVVWFRKYPSSYDLRSALSIHRVKVRDEKWPLLFFHLRLYNGYLWLRSKYSCKPLTKVSFFSLNFQECVLAISAWPSSILERVQYLVFFQTVRSTQWVGTQYAKILLYRTQTSIFTIKRSNFQTNSNKYKMFARLLRSSYLGSFQHLEVKHWFFWSQKSRKSNKETHQSWRLQ